LFVMSAGAETAGSSGEAEENFQRKKFEVEN
jgi:hypothetical protein